MKLFAVYDRDYYCPEEIDSILADLKTELTHAHIHEKKEIENYFLNISVLEKVLTNQIRNKNIRSGLNSQKTTEIATYLENITKTKKAEIQSQYIGRRLDYYKGNSADSSTISRQAIESFEELWDNINTRMNIVPGKYTLRMLRSYIQRDYGVNLTDVQIIDEFKVDEIPHDLKNLINDLETFRTGRVLGEALTKSEFQISTH
ncbi:MAG: hypothetical protein WC256_00925 [Desulfurivibrionaceae bacterium]|jgi:hypothetical protein